MEEAWELAVVSTSASRLFSFLSEVIGDVPLGSNNTILSSRVALVLNLQQSDEGEAYIVLRDMVRTLMHDVTNGLESDQVSHVMTLCAPLQPLTRMTTYDQPIRSGNAQYLSNTALSNLKTLDLILSARITREEPDFGNYQEAISNLQDAVTKLKLDPLLETAINKRILQVEYALRNYLFVGPSTTVESIESLIGSIELLVPKKTQKSTKGKIVKGSLATLAGGVLFALSQADQAGEKVISLIENHTQIAGYLEDKSADTADEIVTKETQDEEE